MYVSLDVVRFCAIECSLQMSGERSVAWMLNAWVYAQENSSKPPTVGDVLTIGSLVEPIRNSVERFRQVGVRVGWDIKPDAKLVPVQMVNLMEAVDSLTPSEFCKEYLEVHPWVDGNGRSSQVLYNWLSGTLDNPDWHGNWWNDPRRLPGDGAPKES